MVFEYTVKYNGKRYLPGEDVPMEEPKTEEVKADPIAEELPEEKEPVPVKGKGKKKAK